MNTLIVLKVSSYYEGIEAALDKFCKDFNDFFIPLKSNGDKTVIIDQCSQNHRDMGNLLSIVMNRIDGAFYRQDINLVTPEDRFRRVIIIANKKTKIRSTYYEILGKAIPSETVRIYLVDE